MLLHEMTNQPRNRSSFPYLENSKIIKPGSIDLCILKRACNKLADIFTRWYNLCLSLFPHCPEARRSCNFIKQFNTPSEHSSYLPNFLLPTIDKFLENLLANRLTIFQKEISFWIIGNLGSGRADNVLRLYRKSCLPAV